VANTKSALKRVQIAERNRVRNKTYKSAVKTLMKNYMSAVQTYAANPSPELLQEVESRMSAAYSKIDKAVKRGVLHTNNGSRKKSRLAKALKRTLPQTEAGTTVSDSATTEDTADS
jgi:small subunit ribosomal protein S20